MNTEIQDLSQIDRAVALLKKGSPIVFPTETVYGLGAPIFLPEAVFKIFSIKGRPADNPLIAHLSCIEEVFQVCDRPPPSFFLLAKRFWPGPLALVIPRKESVPGIVTAGLATIAVRMPDHEGALQLIRKVGQPLAAPSANLSGRPSPTSALDAWEDLQGKVELILDGGPCRVGIESTVIHLTEGKAVLLRPGHISQEEIEALLGETLSLPSDGDPVLSPGMKYRHYAPKAKVHLRFDSREIRGEFVLSPNPKAGEHLLNSQTLYASFRKADRLGVLEIEVDCTASVQKNAALFNRLLKAASYTETT